MALKVTKADVWAGQIEDETGGLARVLTPLAEAKANFEFVIARRQPDKPGTGVVFVTPVKGRKVQEAAKGAGLKPAVRVATLRVEGPDKPGIGRAIAQAVADAGVNMRGISAAVMGRNFVAYLSFDSAADAAKAARTVRTADKMPKARAKAMAW